MKKFAVFALLMSGSFTALAGGLTTNTNQNVAFLRNPARGTSTEIDAVYSNPAGVSFLDDGFHFSFNVQGAFQTRTSKSTFAPFAYNGGNETKTYKGTASAAIPSFDFAWKHKRWSVMAAFGVIGGGGRATYDTGLGSFESQVAILPAVLSAQGINTTAYSVDSYMSGSSIVYAAQAGLAFRITDWLSVAAQVRFNHASNGYEGYIRDIRINPQHPQLNPDGGMVSAYDFFTKAAAAYAAAGDAANSAAMTAYANAVKDKQLDSKQSGYGFNPIVGVFFNHKGWSLGVKYEFRTKITVTNNTAVDDTGLYPDNEKSRNDIPALLSVAAGKEFCDRFRVSVEYHHYFDKSARIAHDKHDLIDGGTNEYIAGFEYDITKRWLVSTGVQRTQYNLSDAFYSDMSFSLSSTSWGVGGAFRILENLKLNFAYFVTFYDKHTVNQEIYNNNALKLAGSDAYNRTSHVFGIGLDWSFNCRKR